ncbi:MAG: hypothetical protein KAG66_07610, partial [Methylococcales bacterium]|nr:hypothetical protein [Methylococcales bacterium]
ALMPLRNRESGRWRAFDYLRGLDETGRYRLKDEFTEVSPASVILLEGNFSASIFLRDLIDLAVLLDVPVKERHRRTAERDGPEFLSIWHDVWDDVEVYYYTRVNRPASYDLVVLNARMFS